MKKTLTNNEKENIFTKSILFGLIRRFINFIYALLINGFFGRLFTSHSTVEKSFSSKRHIIDHSKRGVAHKLKLNIAKSFENSRVISWVSRAFSRMLFCSLKEYGAFFLALGVGALVPVTFRSTRLIHLLNELPALVTCIAFIVVGVAFLTGKKRLSEALCESCVMSSLLFNVFGIQKDALDERTDAKTAGYLLPVLFGLCLAALSYFVAPMWFVLMAVLGIAVLLILLFPEIGVLGLMMAIPFASFFPHPSLLLFALVSTTLFSYVVKLIRGKRVFKMRAIDFAVAVFAIIRLTSGFFAAGGNDALARAVLDFGLVCGYFPVVNLMRSKEWIKRAIWTFLTFAAIAMIIGAFQSIGQGYESGWLDSAAFSEIKVRITATFKNPNVFASFLLLAIPFSVVGILDKNRMRVKTASGLILLLAAFCLIQTWSRGAWLGACIAAVAFAMIYSRRTIPGIFAVGVAATLSVPLLLP